MVWGCFNKEPGIYTDAVPAHTWSRIKNPYTWMPVRKTDSFPDIHVKALRNGEIVLNRDFIDSFAWEDRGGTVHTVAVADVPQHPTHGLEIAPDTLWVAFYSPDKGVGFAGIMTEYANARSADGLPRLEQPYI